MSQSVNIDSVLPYFLLVGLVCLAGLVFLQRRFPSEGSARQERWFTGIVFFAAALLMGLRGLTVGVDTLSYYNVFEAVRALSFADIGAESSILGVEWFYLFLMKVFSVCGLNYFIFQVVVAFLYCFGMRRFILKSASNSFLATALFFGINLYLTAFNITRQLLAVMILANAWIVLTEGKNARFIAMVFIAALFHKTALLFFVVAIVFSFRQRKWLVRYLVPLFVIALLTNYDMILEIASIFGLYENYLKNVKVKQSAGAVWIIWIGLSLAAFYVIFSKKFSTTSSIFATFTLAYVGCNVVGLEFNYFERLGCYFEIFVILLLDCISISTLPRTPQRIMINGLVPCFFLVFFLRSSMSAQYAYVLFGM